MEIFRKHKIEERLIGALNNLNLNRKLLLLYLLCVLSPLLITDGYILTSIISNERSQFNEEMKNVAANISADFISSVKTASDVSNNMYVDRSIYNEGRIHRRRCCRLGCMYNICQVRQLGQDLERGPN